jgi:transposase
VGSGITVSPEHWRLLQRWARSGTTPHRVVLRSRIVLLALDGWSPRQIAGRCGASVGTVRLWITRAAHQGVWCIWHDAPGRGRKRTIAPAVVAEIASFAPRADPSADRRANGLRAVARRFGVSATTVRRIWHAASTASVTGGGTAEADEQLFTAHFAPAALADGH